MNSPDQTLKSADVRARIEPSLKEDASRILATCGLTISDGFRLFLRQVVAQKGLPFPVMAPNATTVEAMNEPPSMRAGRFASAQELLDALDEISARKTREAAP